MTDTESRLLAAGDALAKAVREFNALDEWESKNYADDAMHEALEA